MLKKVIVVIVSILAICAVLGLTVRLSYDDMKTAVESVNGSANVLEDDLIAIEMLAEIVDMFDVDKRMQVNVTSFTEGSVDNLITRYRVSILNYTYSESGGSPNWTIESRKYFDFNDEATAQKMARIIKPLTWYSGNGKVVIPSELGLWDTVQAGLASVVFALGILVTSVMFVFTFLLDSVITAWTVVRAGLYILGFHVFL